ncbi:MAG: gamma carbonic anhydrase family protein [Bdellovibrionaceae bacterium]|nr:gamma carbonic anhydrase family protein [Pseudobdellovibrionaceae bacterium]
MSLIRTARGFTPKIQSRVFIAESANIIGDVEIGEDSSIWYQTVIRGDVMPIRIGKATNIQDGSIIHGTYGKYGTTIGDEVTIGHQVVLHGTTVSDRCLIGMGSILMDGSFIASNSIVGAGSLVTEGFRQDEEGWLILGRPAKAIRKLKPEELNFLKQSADNYRLYTTWY